MFVIVPFRLTLIHISSAIYPEIEQTYFKDFLHLLLMLSSGKVWTDTPAGNGFLFLSATTRPLSTCHTPAA